MLQANAECCKEFVRDAAVPLQERTVIVAGKATAVLVLVAKSENSGPVFEELIIGLRIDGAACLVVGKFLRIGWRRSEIENRLTGNSVAVCPSDRDGVSQIIYSESRIEWLTGRRGILIEGVELGERRIARSCAICPWSAAER